MADADEDAILASSHSRPSPSDGPPSMETNSPQGSDDEDETVDFRFLTGAASSKQGLPRRGTKDFEPNPTLSQRNTLDASRQAMHDALSALRVHAAGKTHNVGVYVNWERKEEEHLWSAFRGLEVGAANAAEWRKRCVVVYNFKGTHSKTVGRGDRRGWTWFLPEEALYLIERGSLDIRWPVIDHGEGNDGAVFGLRGGEGDEDLWNGSERGDDEDEEEEEPPPVGELPMSLQGAYASFIGNSGLTLERYLVYAGLKRSGYIVQRAPTWDDEEDARTNGGTHRPEPILGTLSSSNQSVLPLSQPSLIHKLLHWLLDPQRGVSNPCTGPLVAPGLYRNYNDVFRALALVPYHSASSATQSFQPPKPPFTISYLIYKPGSQYRKAAPPSPDYRVCVADARSSNVPTMIQIGDLLDSMPEDELKGEGKRLEAKIKHGRRHVLVAVVDMGVVSYLRFAESEIGRYKLYEEKTKRGGKGKGRPPQGKGRGKGQQGQPGKVV